MNPLASFALIVACAIFFIPAGMLLHFLQTMPRADRGAKSETGLGIGWLAALLCGAAVIIGVGSLPAEVQFSVVAAAAGALLLWIAQEIARRGLWNIAEDVLDAVQAGAEALFSAARDLVARRRALNAPRLENVRKEIAA